MVESGAGLGHNTSIAATIAAASSPEGAGEIWGSGTLATLLVEAKTATIGAANSPSPRPLCLHSSVDLFDDSSILPPPPEGTTVLHEREYRVRAYRRSADEVILHGAVRDQKPPGLYLDDDPDPLTIHHMQVSLTIAFPTLEITDAALVLEMYPMDACPTIAEHYKNLIGLSIARGFNNKVRELFGGPRGCTHSTALLQAMAPVAVQCFWSMRAAAARENPDGITAGQPNDQAWRMNIGSCHMWAPESEHVAHLEAGGDMGVPVFLRDRLESLGLDAEVWERRMRTS